MHDMNLTSPIYITRSNDICVAVGISKTNDKMNGDCVQNSIILITQGLKILSYVSWYLSGKYQSSCRLSFESQIDSVKW